MKLWQKVYLFTMILFVVLLNVGMYVVFELTYQKDIGVEQKQAEAEYNMLTDMVVRSLNSLYNQGDVTDAKLRRVMEKYENYYDDTLCLTLWKGENCVYPEKIGRQRNESAAAGNGINKTCQKQQPV